MKLFIIPFAGGMSSTYLSWKDKLKKCEVVPITLKGREERISEALYTSFDEAVADIKDKIIRHLDEEDDDFILFGHSMGAFLAYEVYYALKKEYISPEIIFISGRKPPVLGNDTKPVYRYKLNELKEEMISKGGMDGKFFESDELVDLFVPIIRADYKILYDYKFKEHKMNINSKVVVLNGRDDTATKEEMLQWNKLTEEEINYYEIPGRHFFLMESQEEVLNIIEDEIG